MWRTFGFASDLDAPLGQRHGDIGTCNHLLQLGEVVYLDGVALWTPTSNLRPGHVGTGSTDEKAVTADWDAGRRLRGWVARTDAMDAVLAGEKNIFGRKIALPWTNSSFDFAIPNGSALFHSMAQSLRNR